MIVARVVRRAILGLLQVLLSPLLAACWVERRLGGGERVFTSGAELVSLVPGWPGSMLRKAFYRATLQQCAERAYISFGAMVVHRAASIARDAYIGPYCVLGAVTVGEGAKIATRVSVMSGRHQHSAPAKEGAAETPRFELVEIGAGAWIGEGAVVMANVGRNAVVGAASVVVHDVPDGITVAGNPAHEITHRASAGAPLVRRASFG